MHSPSTVSSLKQRISEMQPLRLQDPALPTPEALGPLLPSGKLRAGASYAVHGSLQLALALLTEASRAGAWCGIIGCPEFGAESAASLGIALDRCILIPDPGDGALSLTGSLSEILTIVLLHSSASPRGGVAERISARLREHGSALIVTGDWPRSVSTLRVTASRWSGLEEGHGKLATRELSVQARDARGSSRHTVRFVDGAVAQASAASELAFLGGAAEPRWAAGS